MKYVMCNIHIKDYYSKYFVYNYSNFIMFYSTSNVIFYKINDRIGLTHVTIEYTHDRTRFTHDTIGLIFVRIE